LHIELPRQNQDLFLPSRHTVITTKKEKVKGDLPSTSSIIFYLNSKNISGLNTGILMKFVRMESEVIDAYCESGDTLSRLPKLQVKASRRNFEQGW
jgi:hypothetical protein